MKRGVGKGVKLAGGEPVNNGASTSSNEMENTDEVTCPYWMEKVKLLMAQLSHCETVQCKAEVCWFQNCL